MNTGLFYCFWKHLGVTREAFNGLASCNIEHVSFDPWDRGLMYVTTFGASVRRGPAVPQ